MGVQCRFATTARGTSVEIIIDRVDPNTGRPSPGTPISDRETPTAPMMSVRFPLLFS
jgi:hypothetical protein